MTLDSAIVQKNYQNPNIVRPRPVNLVLNANGVIEQQDVPPPPDDAVNVMRGGGVLPPPNTSKTPTAGEKTPTAGEKAAEDGKTLGKGMFTVGLLLAGFIVYKLLTVK